MDNRVLLWENLNYEHFILDLLKKSLNRLKYLIYLRTLQSGGITNKQTQSIVMKGK